MRTKTQRVEIRLSDSEADLLDRLAIKTRLSRSEFIRRLILNCKIKEAPPVDYFTLISELRRIGSNINQVLKVAYTKDFVDVPLLRKTLDDYRKTEQMIWKAFSPEDG